MLTLTPHEFVDKWKQVTARERQIYQEHFLDLCYLLGHPTLNSFDPTGKRFGFEMGAAKTSGGQGSAYVAKLEYFGWEYKARPEDLLDSEKLKILRAVFRNPEALKPQVTDEGVTREAALQFSRLAENLRKYGNDSQQIAHFLIRLLFCLFAEDIGLLPERIFPRLLALNLERAK